MDLIKHACQHGSIQPAGSPLVGFWEKTCTGGMNAGLKVYMSV